MKLLRVLNELGIQHRSEESFLLVSRDSLSDIFPGEKNTLPEDRSGSFGKARIELQKQINARIIWSKFDDEWLGVDRIIPDDS